MDSDDGDQRTSGRPVADGGEETASFDDGIAGDDHYSDGSPYDLRRALAEHRPHVLFATVLFALGTLLGVALALAEVNLLQAIGLESSEELFEGVEFTARSILLNNTTAFLVMVAGAVSLGIITVFALVFNGVIVGWLGTLVAAEAGVGYILALLLPHGIFELPALFVAAGIGFRLVHLAVNYLRGVREHYLSRPELGRTLLLLFVAWIALAIAAVVEVYVTPAIADAIFGSVEQEPPV